MSHRRVTWPWQIAAVALALMTLAVGFCLFHDDGTDTDSHAVTHDLCGGLLASLATVTLLALAAVNRVLAEPPRSASVVTLGGLDPPPRSLHLS